MKKIFMVLLVLFLIYFGFQIGYSFFENEHNTDYTVITEDKKFTIKEVFSNEKNLNSYFFEIVLDEEIFDYQISYDFKKSKQVIKNIYYYKDDEYSCILPLYSNNQVVNDILCKKDNIIYNYHNIKGQNEKLDNYVLTLKEKGYDEDKFTDNSDNLKKEQLTIYENNLLDKKYYALSNYKGVYLINNITGGKLQNISIFKNDVYKRPLSIFYKKYYVVADYNKDYRFDKFYVIDITNGKIKEIEVGNEVSFDSYIQGTENNSIYFFDKTYKIQYEINLKTNKIIEVGNENTGIKILTDGIWERISAVQALNQDVVFTESIADFNDYELVHKVGSFYYLYAKNGSEYKVYSSNAQNFKQKAYLFDTSDTNRIVYDNNFIYYIKDSCIKYYKDDIGERTLVCDNEINYNTSIVYGVYTN